MVKASQILLVTKVTRMVLLINNSTAHDLFFYFSGHVNDFELRVYENGWREKTGPTKRMEANEANIEDKLNEMLSYLNDLYMKEVQKINV